MGTFINNQRLAQLAGVHYNSEALQIAPIVYSRTHTVVQQFHLLRKFPECILVTSFSDDNVTGEMLRKLPPNVRLWFSNNVEVEDERVVAVPIGIRTSPKGEVILRKVINEERPPERNLVYMNFYRRIKRSHNPRRGIYEQFEDKEWITTEGGFDHVPMDQFYRQIAAHPYVLSPPGAGPDCHRHWESIMLGSIPIVLKSPMTKLLDDLPCLQVENWDEVTPERLQSELEPLRERFKSPAMEKVWFEYWQKRITEA